MWDQDAAETKNLISTWDLVIQDKELTGNIKELEAATHMITSSPKASSRSVSPANSIIEVDLTAMDDDNSQEVSEIQSTRRVNKRQAKLEDSLADMSNVGTLLCLNYLTERCWSNSSLKMCGWIAYEE